MNKKSFLKLALAGVLSIGITGCGSSVNNEKEDTELVSMETMVFEPYKHVYFERYVNNVIDEENTSITRGQVVVPDGYEIIEIEPFSSRIGCFDVWFANTETVEVMPIINDVTGEVEYSMPGKVIEEKGKVYQK